MQLSHLINRRWGRPLPSGDRIAVLEWRPDGLLAMLVRTADTRSALVDQFDHEPCQVEGRSAALARLARRQQWAARQRVVLMLGTRMRQMTIMPRPAVPDAEVRDAVRWQLAGTLDYPAEDALLDMLHVGLEGPADRRQLMVFAIHRQAWVEAVAPLLERRLTLQAVDVVDCAQRNLAGLHNGGSQPVAVVALRDRQLLFTVSRGSELVMSRSFDAPHAEGTDERTRAHDEDVLAERIGLQLQRTLDALERRTPQSMPATVLLLPHPSRQGMLRTCAELTGLRVLSPDLTALMPDELPPPAAAGQSSRLERSEFTHLLGAALRSLGAGSSLREAA